MMASPHVGLTDEAVVVTGGSRGLGLSLARAFQAAGMRVAITGRYEASLRAVEETHPGIRGYTCDSGDPSALAAFSERVRADMGNVGVLVNNAGINPWYGRSEDVPLDQWRLIVDVNLTGAFAACQLFGRGMLARGRGSIINISSIAARSGLPRTAAYCAAKGGLEAMTRSLAVDWASRGVRVNCIAPGYLETDLTSGLRDNPRLSEMVRSRTPMGRFGEPHELIGACLFLASPAASYVTGQSLQIDGGWTAS